MSLQSLREYRSLLALLYSLGSLLSYNCCGLPFPGPPLSVNPLQRRLTLKFTVPDDISESTPDFWPIFGFQALKIVGGRPIPISPFVDQSSPNLVGMYRSDRSM